MSVYCLENIEEGISHEIDNPERRDIGKKISGLRAKKNKISEQILKHQKEGDNKKLPGVIILAGSQDKQSNQEKPLF